MLAAMCASEDLRSFGKEKPLHRILHDAEVFDWLLIGMRLLLVFDDKTRDS